MLTAVENDQVAQQFIRQRQIGKLYRVNGFQPRRPVALFNSLSGCVVEVVESKNCPNWAKENSNALWVDIAKITGATLGNISGLGHTKTADTRKQKWKETLMRIMDADHDGGVDPTELLDFLNDQEDLREDTHIERILKKHEALLSCNKDKSKNDTTTTKTTTAELLQELKPCVPKIMATLTQQQDSSNTHLVLDYEGSTEFTKHMQLRDGWKDPPGIKVRPRAGIAAMECLVANDPSGLAAKLGAALMLGVTVQLQQVGYEEGKNLVGFGYDWRMPCTKMEERDSYFSNTMKGMEELVKRNGGEKIVVVTHSLGGVCASYFFHWVAHSDHGRAKGGVKWLEQHIHAFCPIGGPMLGTPYGSASYLSGDEGQGLAPMVFSFSDRHLVVRSWGMFGMIFPTGRHLMLQPTHSVHWVRREAVLNVHLLSVVIKRYGVIPQNSDDTDATPYFIKLVLTAPVSKHQKSLTTSTEKIRTEAAFDQHFQFAYTSTPDKIDEAQLEISFWEDVFGPIDKELAKGDLDLGAASVQLKTGGSGGFFGGSKDVTTLEGLAPNEWRQYEIKLKNDDYGQVLITMRLQFVPHSDATLCNDFSRPATEDPGAWRCGGPADISSTPEKQARLLKALGAKEGTEWRPEVKKLPGKGHTNATYAPMTIDQMMVYDNMQAEYKWWKECYADDEIWRSYSTEAPQGVRRIRPIYGINVPTLVGNVYRRATKRFIRFEPTTRMKLDKHCEVSHPGYKVKDGIVEEVPHQTPQADDPTVPLENMTFKTRASGDGTVAYWSLRWPVVWRSSGIDVEPVEVEGADHRNILDKPECSMAVLAECCSYPMKYLEIELDSLVIKNAKGKSCMSWLTCISTMGIVDEGDVFLLMKWRGVDFTTEHTSEGNCKPNKKDLWSQNRFVFGVTKQDLDDDQELEISVRKPQLTNVSRGTLREGSKVVKMPIKILLDNATDTSKVAFDGKGDVTLQWSCRQISVGNDGMPKCQ
jgi:hypothetical protein